MRKPAERIADAVGILWPLILVALIWAMAIYVTGRGNRCIDAGGRHEFSTSRWSGEECVRDGKVIEP